MENFENELEEIFEAEMKFTTRTAKALGVGTEGLNHLQKGLVKVIEADDEELFAELKRMPKDRRNIVLNVYKKILSGEVDLLPFILFLKKQKNEAKAKAGK
jgi:hypothetical protein